MFPIEYKIKIWDEIDEKERIVYGITIAENYADGIKKIESYYGDTIIEMRTFMNETCPVYELNDTQDENHHGLIKVTGEITSWDKF